MEKPLQQYIIVHPGGSTTISAGSSRQAIERFEQLNPGQRWDLVFPEDRPSHKLTAADYTRITEAENGWESDMRALMMMGFVAPQTAAAL